MKRTAEEKQEWREKMYKLSGAIAAMDDEKRAAFAAKYDIFTCEGHPLSVHNQCMLIMQTEGILIPTQVGGFNQWKKAGRQVMKGQHSCGFINVPMMKKQKEGEEKAKVRFRFVPMFDVTQTEPIDPDAPRPKAKKTVQVWHETKDHGTVLEEKEVLPTSTKYLAMAEGLTSKIEHNRREMTQNPTPKRMRQYKSRLWEADNLERLQRLLYAIDAAMIAGTLPEELKNVKTKAALQGLVYKGADSSQGYYSGVPDKDYRLDTPAALAAQRLIGGETEEDRKRAKAQEVQTQIRDLTLQRIDGFYPTPEGIAKKMVELAEIEPGHTVLEPSAGTGNLITQMPEGQDITGIEMSWNIFKVLKNRDLPAHLIQGDFLEMNGELGQFDRIVMNPPFDRGADIKHIRHAMTHLKDGGKLVALCAGGQRQVAELHSDSYHWEPLPEGSFKEAGTGVNVAMLVMEK